MRSRSWRRWVALLAGGAVLLQAPSCAEITASVANVAEIVTAGAVIYITMRIME